MSHLRVYVIQPKDEMSLDDIKKKDNKILRSYLTWFNPTAIVVRQPDEKIVHIAIMSGINRKTKLYRELKKNLTSDLGVIYF